ncbi:MAG: group III truncated hemoglobin [Bacteroidetes bacterium]|nr:group III truncated hemoglobin [Bacteroidota bacterium]
MKRDIKGKEDLHLLMEKFYAKATKDEVIGVKFEHIDMEEHLPKIVEFWSTIIFFDGNYKGSPFDKHVPLHLEKQDFERWLMLFEATINELFEGEKADEVLQRAQSIARIFLFKIESLNLMK